MHSMPIYKCQILSCICSYLLVLLGVCTRLNSTKLMYPKIINNLVYAKNHRHHFIEHHRFAILPYSQLINWHTTTPSKPATHNDEPKKSPTLLLIPFFLSAGVFAIPIPRRHMAVIIKAKKQAYKMVCSP